MPSVASNVIGEIFNEVENAFAHIREYIYQVMKKADNLAELHEIVALMIVEILTNRLTRCDKDKAYIDRFIYKATEHIELLLSDIIEQITDEYTWDEMKLLTMEDYDEIILF